MYQMLRSINKL